MTLEPLLDAPVAVQAHVATVLPAAALGLWLLAFSHKGSRGHRAVGVLFLTLMVTTALIALFIHRRTPEGPVFGMSTTHLFVPFVGAILINGLNNVFFLPGITHDVFFGR